MQITSTQLIRKSPNCRLFLLTVSLSIENYRHEKHNKNLFLQKKRSFKMFYSSKEDITL